MSFKFQVQSFKWGRRGERGGVSLSFAEGGEDDAWEAPDTELADPGPMGSPRPQAVQ